MEKFYYEETDSKKNFIKCLIIIFIIGIFIGIFYYKQEKNTLKLKNITIEIGDTLSKNIEDYIENGSKFIDEYKLYLNDVNTSVVGEYTYKIKYNKHTKKGIIKVVDTIKPVVTTGDITIGINEELDLDILIASCNDKSLPCKVALKNENDLKKLKTEGKYEIDIIVSDAVGNKTETTVNITSSSKETLSSLQTNDLNYYTNSENDANIEHTLFIKLDKAINEETLEYEGLIQELSSLDFNEDTDKEIYDIKLITAYNKYSYVIGFQVLVTYTDGTKILLEQGD